MDEVDKIILQSLRQIDAIAADDEDAQYLAKFTPEIVVRAVSTCLQQILPGDKPTLPCSLPAAIAQRFTIATGLAEACTAAGYRGDIGYQTFLYPNTVDLRRLLMYLIEQLPRAQSIGGAESTAHTPLRHYELINAEIKGRILKELRMPWVPQYCRYIANRQSTTTTSSISQCTEFKPQLNLNIPSSASCEQSLEVREYFQQQAPNVFQQQQTAADCYDLVSSVLHKNANDFYRPQQDQQLVLAALNLSQSTPATVTKSVISTNANSQELDENCKNDNKPPIKPKPSSLEYLSDEVLNLRQSNEEQQLERKELMSKIASLQSQHAETTTQIDSLRKQAKIHERTCVVLEQPEENVPKLEALVAATQERRHTLHEQWQTYRQPLEQQLKELNKAKKAKNIHSLMDMRRLIAELEQELSEKTAVHVQLNVELKAHQASTATRKEYTRRIHEFIGNIRKQSNDIYKVLDDTRDLQKQLNSVSAQLQRQFNYTDDLLFQSAKHDLHAKKAYKLLATLHANCTELIELVAHTGNVTKEIRDLEVQIDNERIKNVAHSLEQITADINKFESLYMELQVELRTLENEITAAV